MKKATRERAFHPPQKKIGGNWISVRGIDLFPAGLKYFWMYLNTYQRALLVPDHATGRYQYTIRPRSARPGTARNEAQSGRIGTTWNETRFGPESLFGWPGPKLNMGRISLPFQLQGPEQSRISSLLEQNHARRRESTMRNQEAAACEALRRRREAAATAQRRGTPPSSRR